MEADNLAPLKNTYWKKMSVVWGDKKEISYERWFMFEQRGTE